MGLSFLFWDVYWDPEKTKSNLGQCPGLPQHSGLEMQALWLMLLLHIPDRNMGYWLLLLLLLLCMFFSLDLGFTLDVWAVLCSLCCN